MTKSNYKKQYCPIVIHQNGTESHAKPFSIQSKHAADKFCSTLEDANDCIGAAIKYFSNLQASNLLVVDSYVKVREVSDWIKL